VVGDGQSAPRQTISGPVMGASGVIRTFLAVGLLAAALAMLWRAIGQRRVAGELAFFYDPSADELFTASSTSIPPIRGVDGEEEDAVRAVVISVVGDPKDKESWQIAYLERYSPELKRQLEQARESASAPEMSRGAAQAHRFVRRVTDQEWYSLRSPEAEAILSGWLTAGPQGGPATICTP